MRGVNKVILVGTLGADPEVRVMPNGTHVANVSLATNESWKDKNTGQQQERTEWHRVIVFGKLAEIAGQYLKKGSQAYFEGKLRTRKWTDQQTSVEKYTTEVVVDINGQMQMLGGGNGANNNAPGGFNQNQSQNQAQPQQAAQGQGTAQRQNAPQPNQPYQAPQGQQPGYMPQFDDDIPFNFAPT